jgi:hypothetical protein
MRQRVAGPGEINGNPVDRYTIGHAAFGVLMGLGRVPWYGALGVAVGWEFLEHWLKDHVPRAFPNATQDTLANSTFDAIAMMLGWGAIKALPSQAPVDGALVRRRRIVR